LLDHSRYLTVERHTVQLPDGRKIEDWPWVITPDYACVVAVTSDDRYLCFRQVKYAVEGTTLALVGGYLEPGEEPLAAAKRELLEETGCEASDWIDLGRYAVDGNRGAGTACLYLALGARRVSEADADDLEEQELLLLTRAEIEAALDAGAFKTLGWTAGVALALRHSTQV
jgi:ADP-ribose pyrophosphatase